MQGRIKEGKMKGETKTAKIANFMKTFMAVSPALILGINRASSYFKIPSSEKGSSKVPFTQMREILAELPIVAAAAKAAYDEDKHNSLLVLRQTIKYNGEQYIFRLVENGPLHHVDRDELGQYVKYLLEASETPIEEAEKYFGGAALKPRI